MAQFLYQAVNQAGESITGSIDSVDRRGAVATLADKGYFVTSLNTPTEDASQSTQTKISPSATRTFRVFGSGRINSKDILAFTSQLSTALRAGLPLMNCLQIIRQQSHKPAMSRLLDDLTKSINTGDSLSDAMAKHPNIFSNLYCAMIRVGETGGILEDSSSQLAQLLNREEKIKTNMKNASAYPLIVLTLGLVSVIVIVVKVANH